jgi:uncharacterized protein (DUF779 family)
MVEKVVAAEAALELIEFLKKKHGSLMLHQSGGCCDNSAANCYLPGEITIGAGDEYLGEIGGLTLLPQQSAVRILETYPADYRRDRGARRYVLAGRP